MCDVSRTYWKVHDDIDFVNNTSKTSVYLVLIKYCDVYIKLSVSESGFASQIQTERSILQILTLYIPINDCRDF